MPWSRPKSKRCVSPVTTRAFYPEGNRQCPSRPAPGSAREAIRLLAEQGRARKARLHQCLARRAMPVGHDLCSHHRGPRRLDGVWALTTNQREVPERMPVPQGSISGPHPSVLVLELPPGRFFFAFRRGYAARCGVPGIVPARRLPAADGSPVSAVLVEQPGSWSRWRRSWCGRCRFGLFGASPCATPAARGQFLATVPNPVTTSTVGSLLPRSDHARFASGTCSGRGDKPR